MFTLRTVTSPQWTDVVLADFDAFLNDHAAAEKKASGMAMSMALHYKDKSRLVKAMLDLAIEELMHFREVVHIMDQRGLVMLPDEKDPYINQLRKHCRQGPDIGLIDRLIMGSIVEARGAERFGLIANAISDEPLKRFYTAITRSEDKHHLLFIDLGYHYFDKMIIDARLDEWLDIEAEIVSKLPYRAALH